MAELVLKNLCIVDGSGAPAFYGDIAVTGDTIENIGAGLHGKRELDCTGLTATPGFVDIHNHSDGTLHEAPEAKNYIFQGVTTMLVGNCGVSFKEAIGGYCPDKKGDETAFGRHLDEMDAIQKGNNVCALIGHGGTIMAIMERFAMPRRGYFDYQVGNGEGFVLNPDGTHEKLEINNFHP